MTYKHYHKYVNTNNRNEMIKFLTKHFRYFTMNPWNQSKSYANNVKIQNLGIENKDLRDKAYDIVLTDIDTNEMYYQIQEKIDDFTNKYHYAAGFNGRSSGYLVLYQTEVDHNNTLSVYPGRPIGSNDPDYFEDWTNYELKDLTLIVCAFDNLCDEIRNLFISYAKDAEIIEEKEVIVKTTKILTKEN